MFYDPYTKTLTSDDGQFEPVAPANASGDYVVRMANGNKTYVPLSVPVELPTVTSEDNGDVLTVVSGKWAKAAPTVELPEYPSEDGDYVLVCTVSSDTVTLSWETAIDDSTPSGDG